MADSGNAPGEPPTAEETVEPQGVAGGLGMVADIDPDAARWRQAFDMLDEILRLLRQIVPGREA